MRWQDQRGMALLITVMTISLLIAVTVQYHKTTWQNFLVANHYKVGNQLRVIADSGINIALALLKEDSKASKSDSFLDGWGALEREKFESWFPDGNLRVKVIDLSGRLQVNSLAPKKNSNPGSGTDETVDEAIDGAADNDGGGGNAAEVRQVFLSLLMSGLFPIEDETEARSIVDSLVDWIDEDDQESDLGAESSYYQSLEKPYSCRNGPVRYLEELLLVKGITPALLFGAEGSRGLADFLTVKGDDGRVNLNTAPLLLIKSLDPLISDDLLEKLDEYRRDKTNEESLATVGWYKNINGWPGDIVINEQLLTIASTYFQIMATGEFNTLTHSVEAVVQRSSEGEIKLLGKKME